jgi:DNA-binding CsgD family transcriptional regulator
MAVTRLAASQIRALNQVVLALYDEPPGPLSLETIIDRLLDLFPGVRVSIDEALSHGKVVHRAGRHLEHIPQVEEKVTHYCPQNPVVAHALQNGFAPALRVSDFATFREVQKAGYYNEMLRYLTGWRDQAAMAVSLPRSMIGFGLNRDKTFSDEEKLMMELLHPHLERVLRRSVDYLPLESERNLTAREREILHWVAEGKRDQEIAVILRISARTVEQHVRVCREKLGVETRVALAAHVWRARAQADTHAARP